MIFIRKEQPGDINGIREFNEQAFGQRTEANIVDKLRGNSAGLLSLVAIQEDRIVGHILFSPAEIEQDRETIVGMGLAPMAVLPEYKRQGIGSLLVQKGISILKNRNCPFIMVLVHPEYYPRFGFERASLHGIRCQWDVSDDAFMILVLDRPVMKKFAGTARYQDEFNEAI
jgi:putative acetyltransferase